MAKVLDWVDENKMEHQFAVFTQTAVGKMLLQHAPHHCTVHFPFSLPFESLHARAKVLLMMKMRKMKKIKTMMIMFVFMWMVMKVEDEYPTLEEDIKKFKQREVHWKDMVWNLWQLSHVHEMAHRDPEALPIHVTPLSFRQTVCSRGTLDLLHQARLH